MTSVVLDASITLGALCHDEQNARCMAILENAVKSSASVPPLWAIEVGNILEVKHRQKRLSFEDVADIQAFIGGFEHWIDVDQPMQNALAAAALARKYTLTVYDAAYLELALRINAPLATLDTALAKAARKAGVRVLPE